MPHPAQYAWDHAAEPDGSELEMLLDEAGMTLEELEAMNEAGRAESEALPC